MYTVGRIDREKYRCITEDIVTDEVIITEERIEHIENRHPGSYHKIKNFIQQVLDDPDYILEDGKNKNTGLILKFVEENGVRFQIVLRIHTSKDQDGFKNSIISGWNISESRWRNYVKNKKILYKKA